MKTFSRQYVEEQYRILEENAPELTEMFPFDYLLTENSERLRQITRDIDHTIDVYDSLTRIGAEISVRDVFEYINLYGHSMVMSVDPDMLIPGDYLSNANIAKCLSKLQTDVFLNIPPSKQVKRKIGDSANVFVHLRNSACKFTFGSLEYECGIINIVTPREGWTFLVPLNVETRRIFRLPTRRCARCSERCIRKPNVVIQRRGAISEEESPLEVTVIDFHTADPEQCNEVDAFLMGAHCAIYCLEKYSQSKRNRAKRQRRARTAAKKGTTAPVDTVPAKDDGVRIVMSFDTEEKFVSLPNAKGNCRYGAHHRKPKAHFVPGYWKRRSKYDPTLIYIKPFARGGTSEERAKIDLTVEHKQKVYRIQ